MKIRIYYLLFVIAIVVSVSGCQLGGRVYDDDLGNGYAVLAADMVEDAKIVKKGNKGSASTVVIHSSVFAYGWNEDFIIAKQHPQKKGENFEYDNSLTYWYILEVSSGNVHGPLTEREFNELRINLKVPPEIKFKKVK